MSEFFNFWSSDTTPKVTDTAIDSLTKAESVGNKLAGLQVAKSGLNLIESTSGLLNLGAYKAEKENAIQSIKNQVLAAQDDILQNLSYNTDQTIVYAARGNVSIGSGVLQNRFAKGAERAGRDFKMLDLNAKLATETANISYARKKRALVTNAISGVLDFATSLGMAYAGGIGGSGNVTDVNGNVLGKVGGYGVYQG